MPRTASVSLLLHHSRPTLLPSATVHECIPPGWPHRLASRRLALLAGSFLGLALTVVGPVAALAATTVERRVATSKDDAEQAATGKTNLSSNDLELVVDGSNNQTVGMRWTNLTIPPGAIITAAYIQFAAKESQSVATSLTIQGQATDSATAFASTTGNISTRPRTTASTNWAPVPWTAGQTGANQRTPDLSPVFQEIVNRPGWVSGNALVVIVTGTGHRTAYSYEGSHTLAPLLHVEYSIPDVAPTARLSVTQLASPALTVKADASASTDTDDTPIASYQFDFGDGTAPVTTTAPTVVTEHTYAAAGTYTVSLTATDTGGLTSAPATANITVNPPPPDFAPTAQLSVTQLASPDLTVKADASASTDTDATPIATYQFDFGDGTPAVTTTAPTAVTQHTYAATGTYTVTLTATDTGGLTSAPATASITVEPPPPDSPPTARLSVTQLGSPPLTVKADASASTDPDATPVASYQFDFGDGTPAVTITAPTTTAQHTYAAAGVYTVTLTATDTGSLTSAPATASIVVTEITALERRTTTSFDDAEEYANGTMSLTSSDLELVYDGSNQTVGMRWTNLTIPRAANITTAYIQFSAKESQSEATSLTIRGQAADNATTFTATAGDISTRPRTTAATSWAPVPWTAGEVGPNQRTPSLSAPVQEVVSRPGWASGNALVIIITGTGHRTAWAYNGNAAASPLLHIEYTLQDVAPTARLSLAMAASPPLTVTADASASTDPDSTAIATYRFEFGDGSPAVTATFPTATAQHTYAAPGIYTVTLTATDTGGYPSTPATASITVNVASGPMVAVYAGYYDTHHPANTKPKPDPWQGSPNVVFVGQPDGQPGDPPGGGWDTSTLRIDNLTNAPLSGVVVTCDIGTHHYALWGTNTIPVGYHLILAQTAFENFDGSDTSPAGCYGCDPSLCLTAVSSTIPAVHVTVGTATTTDYPDTGQVLNTGGADAAGCPYVGGPLPQTRYDESENWLRLYPATSGPSQIAQGTAGAAAAPAEAASASEHRLWLGPALPNPAHGWLAVRFGTPARGPVRLDVYDVAGRRVRESVDTVLDAGNYILNVDLGGASPGMYFLKLWTPAGALHKAFVLMK